MRLNRREYSKLSLPLGCVSVLLVYIGPTYGCPVLSLLTTSRYLAIPSVCPHCVLAHIDMIPTSRTVHRMASRAWANRPRTLLRKWSSDAGSLLVQCWTYILDDGPALNQHLGNVPWHNTSLKTPEYLSHWSDMIILTFKIDYGLHIIFTSYTMSNYKYVFESAIYLMCN